MSILDHYLSAYVWWRRWRRGHWESWHMAESPSKVRWVRVKDCSKTTGFRLGHFLLGPICEDYG